MSEENKPKFKVGDEVRRIKDEHGGMEIGDIGTIELFRDEHVVLKEYGDYGHSFDALVLTESIPIETNRKFQVGDMVKVLNARCDTELIWKTVRVEKVDGDRVWLEGSTTYWLSSIGNLILVESVGEGIRGSRPEMVITDDVPTLGELPPSGIEDLEDLSAPNLFAKGLSEFKEAIK